MDNNLFDKSETIPLYDRVKITIYEHHESLKRQCAIVRTAQNSSEKKAALINYQERYCKFFDDINTPTKLKMINNPKKEKYMKFFYINLDKINVEIALKLTNCTRLLIENMGITKLESDRSTKF